MNHSLFKVKGKHIETKRLRTLKIPAINEEHAVVEAIKQGIENIELIEILPFDPPTERQLEYAKDLGILISEDACQQDLSAMISRIVDKDGIPNEGLVEFATNKGLLFSKYIGKRALYNRIFYDLSDLDRVAFFVFSIYRYISDDRHANLDTHPNQGAFYEFANSVIDNERFMKSMNKYSGADIRFFGELTTSDGWSHTGGSVQTIAFKEAREFLINKHLISRNSPYKHKRLYHSTKMSYRMTEEEIADARAKGFKVEVVREITDVSDSQENRIPLSSVEKHDREYYHPTKNIWRNTIIGAGLGFVLVFLYNFIFG